MALAAKMQKQATTSPPKNPSGKLTTVCKFERFSSKLNVDLSKILFRKDENGRSFMTRDAKAACKLLAIPEADLLPRYVSLTDYRQVVRQFQMSTATNFQTSEANNFLYQDL